MTAAIIAQTTASNTALTIGMVVVGLGSLASLAVSLIMLNRFANGKANERQIEPTTLAAMQAEMKSQTSTLNRIDREVGEVGATLRPLSADVQGLHQRVSGISRDLAGVSARVEGLEKREQHRKP